MALAYNLGPAKVTGTGTALVSASFTYPAGALIVVATAYDQPGTSVVDWSPTLTGMSLTWTKQVFENGSNNGLAATDGGGSAIHTAVVGVGGATGTITATFGDPLTGASHEKFMQAVYFTDTGTPTPGVTGVAAAVASLPSVALSGLTVGSFVVAVNSDWVPAGASATCTPGTAQTDVADDFVAAQYAAHFWRTTAAISGTSQTMNLTAPTGQTYNLSALEIKANSGGAATSLIPQPSRRRRLLPVLRRTFRTLPIRPLAANTTPQALPAQPLRRRPIPPALVRRAFRAVPVRPLAANTGQQVLPPQPTRDRLGWFLRSKARTATPLPAAPVTVLSPVPPQPARTGRFRPLLRRAFTAAPTRAAATVTTQALPPQTAKAARRVPLLRRAFRAAVIPSASPTVTAQALPPQPAARRAVWQPRARARTATPLPAAASVLARVTAQFVIVKNRVRFRIGGGFFR